MGRPDDEERRRRARRRALERSRRGHPVGRELPSAVPPPVVARLGEVVDAGDPLDLLTEVSALLGEVASGPSELDVRWLVGVLVEHESPATTTALAVLERLVPDDLLRARVRRELRLREDELPDWLVRLDDLVMVRDHTHDSVQVALRRPGGDGDLALLHARLGSDGQVVDGRVVPSGPLSGWPDCAHLVGWGARVARTARGT